MNYTRLIGMFVILLIVMHPVAAQCPTYGGLKKETANKLYEKDFEDLTPAERAAVEGVLIQGYMQAILDRYPESDQPTVEDFISTIGSSEALDNLFIKERIEAGSILRDAELVAVEEALPEAETAMKRWNLEEGVLRDELGWRTDLGLKIELEFEDQLHTLFAAYEAQLIGGDDAALAKFEELYPPLEDVFGENDRLRFGNHIFEIIDTNEDVKNFVDAVSRDELRELVEYYQKRSNDMSLIKANIKAMSLAEIRDYLKENQLVTEFVDRFISNRYYYGALGLHDADKALVERTIFKGTEDEIWDSYSLRIGKFEEELQGILTEMALSSYRYQRMVSEGIIPPSLIDDIPLGPGETLVYHYANPAFVQDIAKEGLKSQEELAKKGLIHPRAESFNEAVDKYAREGFSRLGSVYAYPDSALIGVIQKRLILLALAVNTEDTIVTDATKVSSLNIAWGFAQDKARREGRQLPSAEEMVEAELKLVKEYWDDSVTLGEFKKLPFDEQYRMFEGIPEVLINKPVSPAKIKLTGGHTNAQGRYIFDDFLAEEAPPEKPTLRRPAPGLMDVTSIAGFALTAVPFTIIVGMQAAYRGGYAGKIWNAAKGLFVKPVVEEALPKTFFQRVTGAVNWMRIKVNTNRISTFDSNMKQASKRAASLSEADSLRKERQKLVRQHDKAVANLISIGPQALDGLFALINKHGQKRGKDKTVEDEVIEDILPQIIENNPAESKEITDKIKGYYQEADPEIKEKITEQLGISVPEEELLEEGRFIEDEEAQRILEKKSLTSEDTKKLAQANWRGFSQATRDRATSLLISSFDSDKFWTVNALLRIGETGESLKFLRETFKEKTFLRIFTLGNNDELLEKVIKALPSRSEYVDYGLITKVIRPRFFAKDTIDEKERGLKIVRSKDTRPLLRELIGKTPHPDSIEESIRNNFDKERVKSDVADLIQKYDAEGKIDAEKPIYEQSETIQKMVMSAILEDESIRQAFMEDFKENWRKQGLREDEAEDYFNRIQEGELFEHEGDEIKKAEVFMSALINSEIWPYKDRRTNLLEYLNLVQTSQLAYLGTAKYKSLRIKIVNDKYWQDRGQIPLGGEFTTRFGLFPTIIINAQRQKTVQGVLSSFIHEFGHFIHRSQALLPEYLINEGFAEDWEYSVNKYFAELFTKEGEKSDSGFDLYAENFRLERATHTTGSLWPYSHGRALFKTIRENLPEEVFQQEVLPKVLRGDMALTEALQFASDYSEELVKPVAVAEPIAEEITLPAPSLEIGSLISTEGAQSDVYEGIFEGQEAIVKRIKPVSQWGAEPRAMEYLGSFLARDTIAKERHVLEKVRQLAEAEGRELFFPRVLAYNLDIYTPENTHLALEKIEGETLGDFFNRGGRLAEGVWDRFIEDLEWMHGKKIIHRDLNPTNIMVTDGGRALKLLDFGTAFAEDAVPRDADLDQEIAEERADLERYKEQTLIPRGLLIPEEAARLMSQLAEEVRKEIEIC